MFVLSDTLLGTCHVWPSCSSTGHGQKRESRAELADRGRSLASGNTLNDCGKLASGAASGERAACRRGAAIGALAPARFSSGDGSELTALLAKDEGMWSDGGGKASAARRPLIGRDHVLNFLIGLHRTAQTAGLTRDVSLRIDDVNSEPALLVRVGQRLESIFVFSIDGRCDLGIRVVRNPDKLAHIDRRHAVSGSEHVESGFTAIFTCP